MAGSLVIVMVTPAPGARADLLGGSTEPIVDSVDLVDDGVTEPIDTTTDVERLARSTSVSMERASRSILTDVIDGTVDTTEPVVDETLGEVGTVLDDDATSNTLTETTDSGTDVATDTVANTSDESAPTAAALEQNDAESGAATTTASDESAAAAAPLEQNTVVNDESRSDAERAVTVGGAIETPVFGDEPLDPGALTVLAVAGGLDDPSVLEAASVGPIADQSIYGRLLGWLTAAGSGPLGLLAGPLLALEILLRALLSAGSGMVAPASLLASYLVRLLWDGRMLRGSEVA